MPALEAIGRRWLIAGDDLVFPLAASIMARFAWIALCASALGRLDTAVSACDVDGGSGSILGKDRSTLVGALAVFSVALVLDVLAARASGTGTILDAKRRQQRALAPLLAACLAANVAELVVMAYSTHLAWGGGSDRPAQGSDAAAALCPELRGALRAYDSRISAVVVWGWIHVVGTAVAVWYAWDPRGKGGTHSAGFEAHVNLNRTDRAYDSGWERRLERLFCCSTAKRQDSRAFSDIAPLFAHLFKGVDLVTSDFVAGLLLLEAREAERDRSSHRRGSGALDDSADDDVPHHTNNSSSSSNKNSNNNAPPGPEPMVAQSRGDGGTAAEAHRAALRREMQDPATPHGRVPHRELAAMNHYLAYAFAVYGWMLHVFDSPCTAPCSIAFRGGGCGCVCLAPRPGRSTSAPLPDVVRGGSCCCCCRCNGCSVNLASFAAQFREQVVSGDVELVTLSCRNPLYLSPYLVCLDHTERALVIALRGTLSLVDAVADANAEPEPIRIPGLDGEYQAHRGMVKIARSVWDELAADRVLERFVVGGPQVARHHGYRVVLCGHSLGAGCGTILAAMIRSAHPELDVHCYAYAPPGAVLEERAAHAVSPYVTSVVLGNDLIPRSSEAAVKRLRDDMIDAIEASRVPKWSITLRHLFRWCAPRGVSVESLFHGTPPETGEPAQRAAEFRRLVREHDRPHAVMLPPGRIAHIVRARELAGAEEYGDLAAGGASGGSGGAGGRGGGDADGGAGGRGGAATQRKRKRPRRRSGRSHRAVWVPNASFDRIKVAPRMFLDHLPDTLVSVLARVTRESLQHRRALPPSPPTPPLEGHSDASAAPWRDAPADEDSAGIPELRSRDPAPEASEGVGGSDESDSDFVTARDLSQDPAHVAIDVAPGHAGL